MAGCCGGKNAGKPIGLVRYLAGLAFFTTYHGVVHTALFGAALAAPRLAPVRDFHGHYFRHLLREAMARDGITVGETSPDEACRIDGSQG